MSIQVFLIKTAIKLTPTFLITITANFLLRGIAKLTFFEFDLDRRTLNVSTRLLGEEEDITLEVEGFGVTAQGNERFFVIRSARSNKLWLTNLLAHVTHKSWPISKIPQIAPYIGTISELLETK